MTQLKILLVVMTLAITGCSHQPKSSRFQDLESKSLSQNSSGEELDEEEKVTVTGSRILRSDIEPKKPYQDIGNQSWQRSSSKVHRTKLSVGSDDELPLMAQNISVFVDGFRARVFVDNFYFNDSRYELEGEFSLRLPEGAMPFYFAFGGKAYRQHQMFDFAEPIRPTSDEIESIDLSVKGEQWQNVKSAVMAKREDAYIAFEATVAKQVDPALLEWSGSGVYSSYVYPMLPKHLNRIVLGYDIELTDTGAFSELSIPFSEGDIRKQLLVSIHGFNDEQSSLSLNNNAGEKLEWNDVLSEKERTLFRHDSAQLGGFHWSSSRSDEALLVDSSHNVGSFFAAKIYPLLEQVTLNETKSHAVFALDVSASMHPQKFAVTQELLLAILRNNSDQIHTFSVLFFNIDSRWWRNESVANNEASRRALKQDTDQLMLLGASDIERALQNISEASWVKNSEHQVLMFLLSDGTATWGSNRVDHLSSIVQQSNIDKLFAYRTGLPETNISLLNELTKRNSGGLFQVNSMQQLQAASKAHRFQTWDIQELSMAGSSDIVIQGDVRTLFPGQAIVVSGRLKGSLSRSIVAKFSNGADTLEQLFTFEHVIHSEQASKVYGESVVPLISNLQSINVEIGGAYSSAFRVPSRFASLLMLESEDDYENNGIPRSSSYPIVGLNSYKSLQQQSQVENQERKSKKQLLKEKLIKINSLPNTTLSETKPIKNLLNSLKGNDLKAEKTLSLNTSNWSRNEEYEHFQTLLAEDKLTFDLIEQFANRHSSEIRKSDELKVLSTLLELEPNSIDHKRFLGFKAIEAGFASEGAQLFQDIIWSRPTIHAHYRDLAVAYREAEQFALSFFYFEVLLATEWEDRNRDHDLVVGVDYLDALYRYISKSRRKSTRLFQWAVGRFNDLDDRFKLAESDLIVILEWNTDGSDVDLHVTEEGGERVYYGNKRSKQKALMTSDIVDGYGPEIYIARKLKTGSYEVSIEFYTPDRTKLSNRSEAKVVVYSNFATRNQKVKTFLQEMNEEGDRAAITEIVLD